MTITNVVVFAVMIGPFLYLIGILFSPAPADSDDYNFGNRKVGQSAFIDTTVMYALQVAAIALFATWGYLYGLSSILVPIFWGAGYLIVIRLLDAGKLDKIITSENFSTLHEFIGKGGKASILASIITLIAISGPAMFEAFFTASVVNRATGTENFPNIILASVFIVMSIFFVWRGGFKGSVFLDQLQLATGYLLFVIFLALFLLAVTTQVNVVSILVLLAILFLCTLGISISRTWHFKKIEQPDFLAKSSLSVSWFATICVVCVFIWILVSQPLSNSFIKVDMLFPSMFSFSSLISLLIANGLYQLVDVGQWQRFLSAAAKPENVIETKNLLKESLWTIAITSPLTWIIANIFGMSIHLIIPDGNAYEATYLAIDFIIKTQPFWSPVLIALLIISLIAIMFSTIDALITATTFTVSNDITKKLFSKQENKNNLEFDRWATLGATIIQFGIYLFIQYVAKEHADAVLYLCWSFQIAFTPAVISALFEWNIGKNAVVRSMLLGIIAACFPVLFLGPETVYEYSPWLALLFSVLGAGNRFFSKSKKALLSLKT